MESGGSVSRQVLVHSLVPVQYFPVTHRYMIMTYEEVLINSFAHNSVSGNYDSKVKRPVWTMKVIFC